MFGGMMMAYLTALGNDFYELGCRVVLQRSSERSICTLVQFLASTSP